MAPARQQRPAPKSQRGAHVLEPIQPSPELVPSPPPQGLAPVPFGMPGMGVPPPMFLAGGLAPYPPHYGVPGPYPAFAPMQLPTPPPEDTVTNFGHFPKDGTHSKHCYDFIKVDHSGNEVWVGEDDAPDGYLSQGDRCEFRIVDAGTKNRRTGGRQWKATDVVCIQRVLPPRALSPHQIKQIESSILEQVEANGGEMLIQDIRAQYQQRGPQSLIKRIKDKQLLLRFVVNTPGLTYDALDDSVRLMSTAAPEPPGELSEVARQLKAREQALIEREEAVARREAVVSNTDGQARFWQRRAREATREPGVSEAMRRLSLLKREQEPPGASRQNASRDAVEADVRALIASTDQEEVYVAELSGRYRRKYGRMLDYKSLGFAKMTAFVAEVPGLELMDGPGGGTVRVAPASDDVSEALRHLSLEPKRDESKTEPVPAGYTVVAAVLQHLDETRLLPTFLAQQIDDAALPYLEPTDLIELGVAPMTCLAILGASAAGGKAKKLETQDVLHDVATHQSVLEAELREHRREIARLRISREEVSEDLCCSITCELMKEPYLCVGDSHTYERVAIEQWFATGARTSPTTNEQLDNLTLVPNHTVRRLIAALLERRRDASGADETKGPS